MLHFNGKPWLTTGIELSRSSRSKAICLPPCRLLQSCIRDHKEISTLATTKSMGRARLELHVRPPNALLKYYNEIDISLWNGGLMLVSKQFCNELRPIFASSITWSFKQRHPRHSAASKTVLP